MKRKICRFVLGFLVCVIGLAALALSFEAVTSIDRSAWGARDYWLAWFSFFSFLLGLASVVIGGGAAIVAAMEMCDG